MHPSTLHRAAAERGSLSTEMTLALAILVAVAIPISFSFVLEARTVRTAYREAVTMEILDGEMEILAAGAWAALPQGEHPHTVNAGAAVNLPAGGFVAIRSGDRVRLEWRPAPGTRGRVQWREVRLP